MKQATPAISKVMALVRDLPKRVHKSKRNSYPRALRNAVVDAVSGGTPTTEIAKLTGISNSAIYKWSRNLRGLDEKIDIDAVTDIQCIEVLPPMDSCRVELPNGVKLCFSGPLVSEAFEMTVLRGLT